MGERDYIKRTLEIQRVVHFKRVKLNLGKPLAFATKNDGACFVTLSGNLVTVLVCFHVQQRVDS